MIWLLIPCLLLGHFAIFVAFINRLHGTATPRPIIKSIDVVWKIFFIGIPTLIGIASFDVLMRGVAFEGRTGWELVTVAYGTCCLLAALFAVIHRIFRLARPESTNLLMSNHTRLESVSRKLGHRPTGDALTGFVARLPGNEILQLSVHEKVLALPRLDEALQGLTITHLSDLHLTGQLTQAFYDELVDQANAFASDIVVITGDILEKKECLPWVEPTLGRLQAKYGVFFVLGNHELRLYDEQLARDTLTGAGLIDVGQTWIQIEHNGYPIVIAGNELPWFPPAANMSSVPELFAGKRPLRIALCHSPDQLQWSRVHDFDLMLAGHTHGGQVRLPLIGPILAPSVFGTRHAAGTFFYEPTLMHVSRGIAGTRPLRFRCPPELTQLVLRR
jgi:predicted MPP superfamily phosphohydrolase